MPVFDVGLRARRATAVSRHEQLKAPAGRGVLAAVSLAPQAGGVGYVGRLIAAALRDIADVRTQVIELVEGPTAARTAARLRFLGRLLHIQAAGAADWIVFNHVGIARVQRLVPAPLRLPYAVFLHGVEVWGRRLSSDRLTTLRRAALLVSNSTYTAHRTMREHPGIGTVHPCPLGLLPESARLANDSATVPDAALLAAVRPESAVIVARMSAEERYKGHDELLECWPDVTARVPRAQLIIVGTGDDLPRLRRKARELGLDEAVLFTGFVNERTLDGIRERVAVLTMPSRGEGFGIVYLEAMRAALPCLGSTDDAAVDVIVPGETGLLVSQRDRRALVDAVCTLMTDPVMRRRMGEAGRQRYLREFTYDRFRDRFHSLLTETICSASRTVR